MMQLLCLSPHLLVILMCTRPRVPQQRNATSLIARKAVWWEGKKQRQVFTGARRAKPLFLFHAHKLCFIINAFRFTDKYK